ncbi:MAG: polymer-forming cytoskeletal protein [Zoogloeaceae bacterium]|jgi:cytoskeletal protein CcmA (bactofilin family)|nr:polymer-forming cytoskeletal protein [Zoogloeaceae bacterium]
MFGKKNNSPAKFDSLIGQDTKIEGNVVFSGGLSVNGEICGQVIARSSPSILMLSESGVINGQVDVTHLVVNGSINGPVRATELKLHPKARIVGDVEYHVIEIQQGALIEGHLFLAREKESGANTNDADEPSGESPLP